MIAEFAFPFAVLLVIGSFITLFIIGFIPHIIEAFLGLKDVFD